MVEWFKAHAWKACDVKASGGSNPLLSANKIQLRQRGFEPKGSHRKFCLSTKIIIVFLLIFVFRRKYKC